MDERGGDNGHLLRGRRHRSLQALTTSSLLAQSNVFFVSKLLRVCAFLLRASFRPTNVSNLHTISDAEDLNDNKASASNTVLIIGGRSYEARRLRLVTPQNFGSRRHAM